MTEQLPQPQVPPKPRWPMSTRLSIIAVIILSILVIGCGSSKPAAPTRDTSTPSKALIGHWQLTNEVGHTRDWYITDTKFGESYYIVVSEDAKAHKVSIKTKLNPETRDYISGPLDIAFNGDYTTGQWVLSDGHSITSISYVDSKQSP